MQLFMQGAFGTPSPLDERALVASESMPSGHAHFVLAVLQFVAMSPWHSCQRHSCRAVSACSAALLNELELTDAALDTWATAYEVAGNPPEVPDDAGSLAVKALSPAGERVTQLGSPVQLAGAARDLRAALALEPNNEKTKQLLKAAISRLPKASTVQSHASPVKSASPTKAPTVVSQSVVPVAVQPPMPPPVAKEVIAASESKPAGSNAAAAGTSKVDVVSLPARTATAGKAATIAAAAATAVSSRSSPILAKVQHWQSKPSTAIDFGGLAKDLRGDQTSLFAYLRTHVDGGLLPTLFARRALEPDILTAVIGALHWGLQSGKEAAESPSTDIRAFVQDILSGIVTHTRLWDSAHDGIKQRSAEAARSPHRA